MGCDSDGIKRFFKPSEFQSTHPVWGATSLKAKRVIGHLISIHAPRVGCDKAGGMSALVDMEFQSTHPVWGATRNKSTKNNRLEFQSTHPVWGATAVQAAERHGNQDFNPRTPCGVRLISSMEIFLLSKISIHAPRVGCDFHEWCHTPHARPISIHAPRVGCDTQVTENGLYVRHFNPRTPCGVRRLRLQSSTG